MIPAKLPKEILIVEDSTTQADHLRYILQEAGYAVTSARDGIEALETLRVRKPSVILSDVVMPRMDGYELCQRVKADRNLKQIPFVLLTTLSDPQDVIKGLNSHADHFITKPYTEDHLLERLKLITGRTVDTSAGRPDLGAEVVLGNQKHFITADRMQILDLLLTTFQKTKDRNKELEQAYNDLKEAMRTVGDLSSLIASTGASCATLKFKPSDVEVLIAEDSPTQRDQLRYVLEQYGYTVRSTTNGQEALDQIRQRKPNLIISDVVMPKLDGYGLCSAVKTDKNLQDIPVILLTTMSDSKDILRGIEAGANYYLTKPYKEEYLLSRIEFVLTQPVEAAEEQYAISAKPNGGNQTQGLGPGRQQILNLLLATYENSVQQNIELYKTKRDLQRLNERLEERVAQRTASLVQEINERKAAEAQRAKLSRDMELLLQSTGEGIIGVDLDGRCTVVNKAAAKMLGYSASEIVGQEIHQIVCLSHTKGPNSPREESPIFGCLNSGQSCHSHDEMFCRRDKTPFPVAYTCHPILESGEIKGAVVVFSDITEQKELEGKILRNQRLESLGTLAGGIAHDLNNVLAPILLSLQILRMRFNDPEDERILASLEASAQRGADMVKQILTFARGVQGERVSLQIGHVVTELSKILKRTFPKSIQIQTVLQPELWPVHGDSTQMHQVLMNLSVNARDAMPKGGTLRLQASNIQVDKTFASMHGKASPGPYVLIKVTDTGTGIPAHVRERMFEPFFTTKALEKGTGLGLSTARSIVESHHGFMTISTAEGKGTEFSIYLPGDPSASTEEVRSDQGALPTGSGELILVIDDEAAILNIAKQTLEMFGYEVLTATNGAEAIALFGQNRHKVRLLLTDMRMPIMDGRSVVQAILSIDPTVKVIVASGMESKVNPEEVVGMHRDAFLQKPYTAERLVKTVHQVLQPSR